MPTMKQLCGSLFRWLTRILLSTSLVGGCLRLFPYSPIYVLIF